MTRRGIWLGLLITVPISIADSSSAQVAAIKTTNDITYIHRGDRDLKLDLTEPAEGNGPFPAVFVIHGGGWRAGNKADCRVALDGLARSGYVAISPEYRFAPKDRSPAQVEDVKAAVRWLREHAKQYKVDPDRIGAMGFSAGGHLALMLGVTGPEDGLEGDDVPAGAVSSKVQVVVNYFGPCDFSAGDIPTIGKGILDEFLGGSPADKPEVARRASPVTYITKGDPPILTFQGTKDPLVPATQAVRLAEAMTKAGIPGRVEFIIGGGHGGWGPVENNRTNSETLAFFDRYLKRKR